MVKDYLKVEGKETIEKKVMEAEKGLKKELNMEDIYTADARIARMHPLKNTPLHKVLPWLCFCSKQSESDKLDLKAEPLSDE